MRFDLRRLAMMVAVLCVAVPAYAQQRYVVIDQDGVGPGGSDVQSILLLLDAPGVKVLGITVASGDVWAEEGARHILRGLELTGHAGVPVLRGAGVPLIRTVAETKVQQGLYGKGWYEGALGIDPAPASLKEGEAAASVDGRSAVAFLIEAVHAHPHEVTIFAGGPMTNIALAIRSDAEFAGLAKELVFMGGSLNPQTDDPEFAWNPRHEFNLWFDPEAAHIVLTAPWAKITQTTVDISLQAKLTAEGEAKLKACTTPSARYMAKYGMGGSPYMWDEVAALAWLDPAVVRRSERLYVDVNLDHGYSYGDTITWPEKSRPAGLALQPVQVQKGLDYARFERRYLAVMCGRAF